MDPYERVEEPWFFMNPVYAMGLLVAGSIYFLFKRYDKVKYRAVPFFVKPPAVSLDIFPWSCSL